MIIVDIIKTLQNLTNKKVSQTDISKALNVDKSAITYRIKRNSEIKLSEIEKIAEYFGVNKSSLMISELKELEELEKEIKNLENDDDIECTCKNCENCTKCLHCKKVYKRESEPVEIFYCEGITDTWKHPNLTSFNFDKEMIKIWNRNPANVRVVAMAGDKMDGGSYPYKNRDILLIDTSATDIEKTGAFLFTTRGGEGIYLCNLNQKLNGDVEFSYKNPEYNTEPLTTYSLEKLKELDFKVIGRVFKNETYNE